MKKNEHCKHLARSHEAEASGRENDLQCANVRSCERGQVKHLYSTIYRSSWIIAVCSTPYLSQESLLFQTDFLSFHISLKCIPVQ